MLKNFKITGNPAGFEDLNVFHKLAQQFLPYAQKKLGFDKPVGVELVSDLENARNPLGKTAYYDPNNMKITLFVDKRHVKDILRSMAHELVHHTQNCRGEFDGEVNTEPGYAQEDGHMRKMEGEAYLKGSGFLFRDWEDSRKQTTKENKTMKLTKKLLKSLIKEEAAGTWDDPIEMEPETVTGTDWGEDFGPPAEGTWDSPIEMEPEPVTGLTLARAKELLGQARQEMLSAAPGGDWTKLPTSAPERVNYRNLLKRVKSLKGDGSGGRVRQSPESIELLGDLDAMADRAAGVVDRARAKNAARQAVSNVWTPENKELLDQFMDDEEVAPTPGGPPTGTGVKPPGSLEENQESIFAPNHYCVHHGGVYMNGGIQEGKVIGHNWDRKLQKVTKYDMQFADGRIVEGVHASDILVTDASLAEGHGGHMAKKDEDEELEERTKRDSADRVAGRDTGGRRLKPLEEDEDVDRAAKDLPGKLAKIVKNRKNEDLEEIVAPEKSGAEKKVDKFVKHIVPPKKSDADKNIDRFKKNENWTRRNKDTFLFERLKEKWCK